MKWSYDVRCNSVPTILLLMQDKLYALGGLKVINQDLCVLVLFHCALSDGGGCGGDRQKGFFG